MLEPRVTIATQERRRREGSRAITVIAESNLGMKFDLDCVLETLGYQFNIRAKGIRFAKMKPRVS